MKLARSEARNATTSAISPAARADGRGFAMLGEKARPVLDHIVEDVGHHIADADGVYPNAMLDRLQCQRAGQLRQRTLRSRIGGDGRKGEVRRQEAILTIAPSGWASLP